MIVQVTFSEKGTKIPQTHNQKLEILEISLWNRFPVQFYLLIDVIYLSYLTEKILNFCDVADIFREMQDYKFSDMSLGSSFLRKSHLCL